ncbi:MAG TPA: anthrax toxin-like adenylyl cyclase domain-containing protein, partial [Longimicrobiaceae bacterium]|nr:anthrax toxin-like adenylyl cyclase domain-containing protein [Longimicrobiaceae bacterium]
MPLYDDPRFRSDPIGMPAEHAECFKRVAGTLRCVIVSRATGPTCKQLLEQGYDTKGFRIHGKSCDWGPMAGLVLRDPRLNKYGNDKAAYNRHEHAEALTDAASGAGWTAATTPVKIYESRRAWLARNNLLGTVQQVSVDHYRCHVSHPTGITLPYDLVRDPADATLWGVWVDTYRQGMDFRQERGASVVQYRPGYGQRFESLLAMTNPREHRSWPDGDFRNAVTGDYDLFAV